MSEQLDKLSWEQLAIRWGRQLSEVIRAFNYTFEVSLDTCPNVDSPSDIVQTIALKEPEEPKP